MFLDPLRLSPDGDLPGPVLTEVTALYASNHAFHALSGDFPDPYDIRPEQVAAELARELADPHTEVLLAREKGLLVGIAVTLAAHPDPADPDPWIGLLMVDASLHGQGHGRRLAGLVEDRLRAAAAPPCVSPCWRTTPGASPSGPPSATRRPPAAATVTSAARAGSCASPSPRPGRPRTPLGPVVEAPRLTAGLIQTKGPS